MELSRLLQWRNRFQAVVNHLPHITSTKETPTLLSHSFPPEFAAAAVDHCRELKGEVREYALQLLADQIKEVARYEEE